MVVQIGSSLLPGVIYRFKGFTFDLVRGALLDADGAERPLRPKTFALLRFLVENAGRLMSRAEILDAVWPGIYVTEDSLSLCVREIRRALDDDAQRLLRTIPRRGYLFAAEMPRLDGAPAPDDDALAAVTSAIPGIAHAAGRPPVLAVLPFINRTGERDQDYFADGLTEDLITALSHYRWFSVIARGSAFAYKGQTIDVRRVGRELAADYLLEGSIRRAGARIRVNALLSAAEDGRQIWAHRCDSDVQDIFTLQDHVVEAVAASIEPSLQRAEVDRAQQRAISSPGTYDLYLRALHLRWQGTREGSEDAAALLRRAVDRDADFAAAWALLADLTGYRISQGWAASGEAEMVLQGARRLAECRTIDNPSALAWAGYALTFLGREYEAGLAAAERAQALAPNSAQILFLAGYCLVYAGEWRRAIGNLDRALRLSPMDPLIPIMRVALGAAYFTGGQYEQAVACAVPAVRWRRDYLVARRVLAASLAWLGRLEEAEAVVADLLATSPSETLGSVCARTGFAGEVRERFLQGLRMAGLPD
jgi:TolB-like protein